MSAPEPLPARSPLAAHAPGSSGWSGRGISLVDHFDVSAAMITLRQAQPGLSRDNAVTSTADLSLVSCGPRRYLAVASRETPAKLLTRLQQQFGGAAAIVDHSDQLAFIRLNGPNAALVLSRLCSIDLDARVFPPLSAAVVRMEGVRAFLWREDHAERFTVGVLRSLAAGAWEALVEAGEALAAE